MIGLPIADKDGFDGLRTTTPIVVVCSDSQPKTFSMPCGCASARLWTNYQAAACGNRPE